MKILSDSTLKIWQQRNEREQYLLIAGFLVVVVLGLYLGLVNPIAGKYHEAESQYRMAFENYRWLQEKSVSLQRLHSETGNLVVSQAVPSIEKKANDELKKLSLEAKVELIKKNAKEFVQIEVQRVPAVKFMRWLDSFSNQGAVVHQLDLKNQGNFLNGTILLGN